VGADGLIYVSDTANDRVQAFTRTGQFVRQIVFTPPNGVLAPGAVAADAGGNVYVFDNADQSVTISKYSSAGTLLWRVGGANEADPDLRGNAHFSELDSQGRLV
jgi:DNA-binding beta-propeller fold protein YncE